MMSIMDGKCLYLPRNLPIDFELLIYTLDCGSNDPNNSLNWKRGGNYQVGQVKYNIIPQIDQGYTPGTCTFHVQEDEDVGDTKNPLHTYHIEDDTLKDGGGAVIGTLGMSGSILASNGSPLLMNSSLPNPIKMTPESHGHDYIQFNFGSESWPSLTSSGTEFCNVGGWSDPPNNDNLHSTVVSSIPSFDLGHKLIS